MSERFTDDYNIRYSNDVNIDEKSFSGALSKQEWARFYKAIDNSYSGLLTDYDSVVLREKDNSKNIKIICYNGNNNNPIVKEVYRIINYDETIHDTEELLSDIISKGVKNGYIYKTIKRIFDNDFEGNGFIFSRYSPEDCGYVSYNEDGIEVSRFSDEQGIERRRNDKSIGRNESSKEVNISNSYSAVNINADEHDFADDIVTRLKTIETREIRRGKNGKFGKGSLDSEIGNTVYIVRTKKGKGKVIVGQARLVGVKVYTSEEEFYNDSDKHLIDRNSSYKYKNDPNVLKVGYIFEDAIKYDKEYPIDKTKRNFGIVKSNNVSLHEDTHTAYSKDVEINEELFQDALERNQQLLDENKSLRKSNDLLPRRLKLANVCKRSILGF